jgi:N-succinyldiaminopimelate aminotransferase
MTISSRIAPARRIAGTAASVFSEFSALAAAHGAINLGQGFPDYDGPDEIKDVAIRVLREGPNQYPISAGVPSLRNAVAAHARRFYAHRVDPETMVTITAGATEALFDTILAFVNPDDEVGVFQPFYDSYAIATRMAGGVLCPISLRPPSAAHPAWWFDADELERLFARRPRLFLLNTPHNPTGKVFTRAELSHIAALAQKYDVLVVCDEVYEHLVCAPSEHLRLATFDDMQARTVTISSGAKTFSLTGWKVGWAIAPPSLRTSIQRTHEHVVFATTPALQEAIAVGLALPDAFFAQLRVDSARRRDRVRAALEQAGLHPYAAEGAFFIVADTRALAIDDDFTACRHLTTAWGVAAIPMSPFYRAEDAGLAKHLARFAYGKSDAVLAEACRRLVTRGAKDTPT